MAWSASLPEYDVRALKRISLALAGVLVAAAPWLPGLVAGQTPAGAPLVLLSSAGRRMLATVGTGDRQMVALDDLAPAFQLSLRDDPLAGAMTVTYKGKTIVVMTDQAIASVGGRLVSLPAPAVRDGRRWLVPVEFISRALALVYDARLDLRKRSNLVVIGDLRVPRVTVLQEVQGGQARVTIEASPATTSTVVQEPHRLLIRFEADALDTSLPAGGSPAPGLIDSIRPAETANALAIVLGAKFGTFRATTLPPDGGVVRTVVDVLPAGPPDLGTLPSTPPPPTAQPPVAVQPVEPLPPVPAPGVHTIVIDPGHGGPEDGARGATGTTEKDVTLTVARKLKAAIENRLGLRALVTRDGDTALSLDDRAAFANNNRADLFISLHANASLRKEVKGAEVFYLSNEGYAQAQQQATTAASLPALGGGSRDIDIILWDMAQTQHLSESAAFAGMVQQELGARVPMNPTPVQQAPFRVLVGATMPAVLVEMGFLTNPEQERQLASPEFQNVIVQALFDAIVRFRDTIERGRPPVPAVSPARPPGLH